jgi:hypothetical protein
MTVATAANRQAKCLILFVGDPANREINREFRRIRAFGAILKADTRVNSEAYSKIPYSTEQGIFPKEQGILD